MTQDHKRSEHFKEAKDNRKGKTALSGCVIFIVSILIILITPILIYYSMVVLGAILIVADPIVEVDAVVILSGDGGDRLGMAADMLERGFVHSLVITNTNPPANQQLAQDAVALGFNPGNIYITDKEVNSTVDEAHAVLQLAHSKGWSSLKVVTDPFHSFRTRIVFRRELRGSGVTISVRPVVGHWFRSNTWFRYQDGWRYVFLEFGKLFNYLFLQT